MSFLPFIQHDQHQYLSNSYNNLRIPTKQCHQLDGITDLLPALPVTNQPSPSVRNINTETTTVLRPEILQYNEMLLGAQPVASFSVDKMFAPVRCSQTSQVDGTGSMAVNNLSDQDSLGLSEDSGEKQSSCAGSSLDSFSFPSSLSSLHSLSFRHHLPKQVLRSKSLNHQPEQPLDFSENNTKWLNTDSQKRRSERRQKSVSDYLPSWPPSLGCESLEVQHPSFDSVDLLHSGLVACVATSPASAKNTKCCPPLPKLLPKSASNSPSAAAEIFSHKRPQILPHTSEDTEIKGVLDTKSNDHGKTSVNYCRRFSVAGTSSVNSLGEIADRSNSSSSSGSSSGSFTSSISSGTSADLRRVCRNPSYESAYGSSNNSLCSSVFDSDGYACSINSYSDSGTDLDSRKDLNTLNSWQDSSAKSLDKASCIGLEQEQTIPKSTLRVPAAATRCTSLPTYIGTEKISDGVKTFNKDLMFSRSSTNVGTTKNKIDSVNKISNLLSKLNDLSLSSSGHQDSLASPGSLLIERHQSLPPAMTFVNIPNNLTIT